MEVTLHTSEGDIHLGLYSQPVPVTIKNLVRLASGQRQRMHPLTGEVSTNPLYNGMMSHRVIDDSMIQDGDPPGIGAGGPSYVPDDEIDPSLAFTEPYLSAMANAGTRGGQGTNDSQSFITVVLTTWLNGKHTIFGWVMDDASRVVVDKAATTVTDRMDCLLEDAIVETIEATE